MKDCGEKAYRHLARWLSKNPDAVHHHLKLENDELRARVNELEAATHRLVFDFDVFGERVAGIANLRELLSGKVVDGLALVPSDDPELTRYKAAVERVLEKRHRSSQKTMHGARVGPDWAKAIGFNEAANLLRVSLGLEPRSLEELTDGER